MLELLGPIVDVLRTPPSVRLPNHPLSPYAEQLIDIYLSALIGGVRGCFVFTCKVTRPPPPPSPVVSTRTVS